MELKSIGLCHGLARPPNNCTRFQGKRLRPSEGCSAARSSRHWAVAVILAWLLALLVYPPLAVAAQSGQRQAIVVTYHPIATRVGQNILDSGGNAFDAFVAATMADYVVAEGATSLAGTLGALVYDAKSQAISYLDADFNDVKEAKGRWTVSDPKPGKAVLVPGAVAGLEELSRRHGRLSFSKVLEPAIELAQDGFKIDSMYAAFVAWRSPTLQSSEYGRRTFFPNGRALQQGDLLRQPEVAEFLRSLAKQGSSYMYSGEWAGRCVETVKANGGLMSREDLASYQPAWFEPWKTSYRDYEVLSSSGRAYGGIWVLMALKTLEHTNLGSLGHFSASADALEVIVRVARRVWSEPWIFDYRQLDDPKLVQSRLTSKYAADIWAEVARQLPVRSRTKRASHSYQILVIDKDGNTVVGTHSHQSSPWGDGTFVEGIPLPTAGMIPWGTRPGERRLSPFSIHLVFKNGSLRFASGAISDSLIEASLQFLVNLIDYKLPATQAVTLPRFGTFPHGLEPGSAELALDWSSNWLDSRVDLKIVDTLKARGLFFQQKGMIDTGLGAVVSVNPNGTIEGATAPIPYFPERSQ
jgi:gamma-glutamyltranspeptidase / glutathione hydrolase